MQSDAFTSFLATQYSVRYFSQELQIVQHRAVYRFVMECNGVLDVFKVSEENAR